MESVDHKKNPQLPADFQLYCLKYIKKPENSKFI